MSKTAFSLLPRYRFGLSQLLFLLTVFTFGVRASSHASDRRVLAFYYTWYATPAVSGEWRHWDEGGHHPDRNDPSGLPDTGTTDHPLALYDSNDPATLRRHLGEARQAGLDGLISTWWGKGDVSDRAFEKLLKEAEAFNAGLPKGESPVTVTVYYERVPEGAADPAAATADELLYVLDRYGSSPAFLRYEGKPVIFLYSRALSQMSRDQWQAAIRRIKTKHPDYLIGDSTDPAWYGVFDTLHEYNPVGAVVGGEDMAARDTRLVRDARTHQRPALLTVIPGYDDSHVGRNQPTVASRDKGQLYARLWNAALDARPDWVVITSFNEWHEGSEIEPSVEHGNAYLDATGIYSRMFHEGKPLLTEKPGQSLSLPPGWHVEPAGSSRFSLDELTGEGIRIANRSGGAGQFRVSLLNGAEPYVFQEGKEGKLWRILPPLGGPTANSEKTKGQESPQNLNKSALFYALPAGAVAQMWTGEAFSNTHPDSPYAEMSKHGLHLEVTSYWLSTAPQEWLAYPDGAVPLTVTIRNTGISTLINGTAETWTPEGWGKSQTQLFDRLEPGSQATVILSARPDAQAPLGQPSPVFVWVKAGTLPDPQQKEAAQKLTFQTSVDLLPVRPLETRFTFGRRGEMTLHLKNRFPGRTLTGTVTLRPAEGRKSREEALPFTLEKTLALPIRQTLPDNETPGLKRTYATLTLGGYRQLASALDRVSVTLGKENDSAGLDWIDWEDGRAVPATGTDAPARKAVPNVPGQSHYLYFDVAAGLPSSGDTYVQVEYKDDGNGALGLQYDSTDATSPLEGRYKDATPVPFAHTGAWKTAVWKLPDARFDGRQNGHADFRLALGPEELLISRVTVSKWPLSAGVTK
jgi:hypothetical protein